MPPANQPPAPPVNPAPVHKPIAEKQSENRPTSPVPAGSQKWFVQVGGFADIANARRVQAGLQGLGQPNVLAPIDTAKGTIYRVRAGPYATQAAAKHETGRTSCKERVGTYVQFSGVASTVKQKPRRDCNNIDKQ